jgi:hypothetical protein
MRSSRSSSLRYASLALPKTTFLLLIQLLYRGIHADDVGFSTQAETRRPRKTQIRMPKTRSRGLRRLARREQMKL